MQNKFSLYPPADEDALERPSRFAVYRQLEIRPSSRVLLHADFPPQFSSPYSNQFKLLRVVLVYQSYHTWEILRHCTFCIKGEFHAASDGQDW